jgi:hypothetical protein
MPVFGMPDEKTIVIVVVDRTAFADVAPAELKTADFLQLTAGTDAFIF